MEITIKELTTPEENRPLKPEEIPQSISRLPFPRRLIDFYIQKATRNISKRIRYLDGLACERLDPSLMEAWEGFPNPFEKLKEILSRMPPSNDRPWLLKSLWESVTKGDVITLVKKGRGNCLDWALAVCLTWNIELRQADPDKKAFLVPFYLPDNNPHFGVVIMNTKTNQPYAYGVFGDLLVLEEEYEEVLKRLKEIERNLESKKERHKVKYARVSLRLIRREVEKFLQQKNNESV